MYDTFTEFLKDKKHLCIIQAENPDGDSLGSALALDYLLDGFETTLYCPVEIPKYMRYFEDWSRVSNEFDYDADGYIIVDTAANVLLSKLVGDRVVLNCLESKPVFVLDHHETEDDLCFAHQGLIQTLPACCDLIYRIAKEQKITINADAAKYLAAGILSDTLGLTAQSVTAETFRAVADLVDCGANIPDLEEKRREFMKKSPRILDYKADLIKRVEYYLDGTLTTVHIPWDEISEYSDEYNPNVLILEELRLVEGVEVAIAIKTYPDGKITGKLRSTSAAPYCDKLAEYFGGGGHPYAAGFRTYDMSYEDCVHEIINALEKVKTAWKNGEYDETVEE